MNALEVIHLRMAGESLETLVEIIRESVESEPGLEDIRLYRHAKLGTDLVVHLHRSNTQHKDRACKSGERLASLLRAYGLVEHSVWIEADNPCGQFTSENG